MANENQAENPIDILLTRVKYPTFFQKLASDWNIVPQNEHDARKLIQMAELLRAANNQEQVKQAAHGSSFLDYALSGLHEAVGGTGVNVSQAEADEMYKQAAFHHVGEDRDVAFAALAYAEYLASQVGNNK